MRGILGLIFICFWPVSTKASSTCFQRIAQMQGLVSAARFAVPAVESEIQGIETDRRYQARWEAKAELQNDKLQAKIDFNYDEAEGRDANISLVFNDEQEEAAVSIKTLDGEELVDKLAGRKGRAHRLSFDLPRNNNGDFLDLNIAFQILSHIHQRSEPQETYSFTLNDPKVVDALNEVLSQELKNIHFHSDYPRRSGNADGDALDEYYFYDLFSESYFPNLSSEDWKNILDNLNSGRGFQHQLVKTFSGTPLGEMIRRSGAWKIEIHLNTTDLVKSLKLREANLQPLLLHYQIQLHRLQGSGHLSAR